MRKLLALLLILCLPALVSGQGQVRLGSAETRGTITTTTSPVILQSSSGDGWGNASVQLSGTWTGTIVVSCSLDYTASAVTVNWDSVRIKRKSSTTDGTSISANGIYTGDLTGCKAIKVEAPTDFTSGTATVLLKAGYTGGGSGGSSGGGGGTASLTLQETDDGSIAGGQIADAVIALDMTFDGTVWRRRTTQLEDSPHVSGDQGLQILCVRSATTPIDRSAGATAGDYEPCQVDANGRMYQNSTFYNSSGTEVGTAAVPLQVSLANTGANGTALAVSLASVPSHAVTNGGVFVVQENGAALTALQLIDNPVGSLAGGAAGTSSFAAGGIYNTTPPTLTNGQQASLQLSSAGALIVTGAAGTTQYPEDNAHVSGDSTVFISALRRDTTPSSSSNAAGDYSAFNVDANGRLYTNTVLYNSAGTELTSNTQGTDDGPLGTITSITGSVFGGYASSTAPTNVSANGDYTIGWFDLGGRLHITGDTSMTALKVDGSAVTQPVSGTVAISGTLSVNPGTAANWAIGATGSAPPANAQYFGALTSGATGGLQQGIIQCDSQGWLNMTTATTTEIAPAVASRTIYICSIVAEAAGTTTMTFQRGTVTNCGTGTTAISPGYELTAQSGFTAGTGIGVVLGPVGSGSVGGGTTASNAVCVTNSAAVNLHVLVRYAVL